MRKLVITQNITPTTSTWRPRALKSQPGQDVVVTGSINLAHTLIAGGVVDEYRLFVYPVVQGRGRRLFAEGTVIRRLTLVEPPKSFQSGITLLRYAV
jgi:dihydrofolate reductase